MALPIFTYSNGSLTIDTDNMELILDRGVVVYIKSHITEEVLLDTAYQMPASPWSWAGFYGAEARLPSASGENNAQNQIDDYNYRLTYNPCYDSGGTPVTDSQLIYDINVDSVTGEISISMHGTDPANSPSQATLPLMNFSGDVLNDMHRVQSGDSDLTYVQTVGGYASPPVVAVIGTSDCLGIWSENPKLLRDISWVDHVQSTGKNTIRMITYADEALKGISSLEIYAGPFRFSCQSHWTEVARRWRARFTSETGFTSGDAKFLWQKNPSWVRDIHCFYRGGNYSSDGLTQVAGLVDNPERIMVLTYNNIKEILYGDNTHFTADSGAVDYPGYSGYPTNVSALRTSLGNPNALPGMGYHSWFRVWKFGDVNSAEARYNSYVGNIPAYSPTYEFPTSFVSQTQNGDIDSTAWDTLWNGKWNSGGSEGHTAYWIHPGWSEFRAYMNINYPDLCSRLNLVSCSWDVGGTVGEEITTQYQDGKSFIEGIILVLQDLYEDYPIATEYAGYPWIPYIWWTWEGYMQNGYGYSTADPSRLIDHPWRNALLGGIFWMHGHGMIKGNNYDYEAYFGAMPHFTTSEDGAETQGEYGYQPSQMRCKMFCDYELYYDLPTGNWEDGVLAYFRSNTGNHFKEIKRDTGRYAYVEMHPNGDYTRLQWEEHTVVIASENQTFNFVDTYTSVPTVALHVNSGTVYVDTVTDSQVTFNVTGSSNFDWMVIGSDETELPSFYSRGVYENLPGTDADLSTPYAIDDIADVAADDTDMVAQLAISKIAIHQFKRQINGTGGIINVVAQVTIPCSTSTTYLQIYNRSGTPAWDTIDSDNATGANTDFTLSSTVADLTDYKDENNIVACRVYQEMQ